MKPQYVKAASEAAAKLIPDGGRIGRIGRQAAKEAAAGDWRLKEPAASEGGLAAGRAADGSGRLNKPRRA